MQVPITGHYVRGSHTTANTKPTTMPISAARQSSACFSTQAANKCVPVVGSSKANNLTGHRPSQQVFFFILAVQILLF
jgi:hypothetical protein